MFLDVAHITCNLLINYEEIVLSKSELDDIKLCHFAVFQKVLRITKSSQVFDNTNKGHSFYVAPVKKNEAGRFDLDWEIIRCDFCIENKSALVRYNPFNNQNIKRNVYGIGREMSTSPILEQVSKAMVPIADEVNFCRSNTYEESDQEPAFMMSEAEYKYFVISPNYRNIHPPQMYIVSKICYDLSPISPFPNSVYADYRAYYQDKYLIRITNPRQPLLKVANVFNCSNFNNPKCQGTQEKLKAVLKNHEELLVPELCDIVPFDRKYWLKALLLPTALNRICHMYCVEEFRRKIVNETGLGELELPPATEWKPLGVDFTITRSENEKADVLEPLNVVLPLSQLKNETTVVADFIDPKRNILEFSVCDMEYIVNFLGNVKSEEEIINSLSLPPQPDNDALIESMKTSEISVPPLSTIKTKESKLGPDLAQLLQAFTSTSANDVINYERLEILGDSFLKFAGSMFLYKHFRDNEGILSLLKGKLVGNRNLLYCGLAKGFQNVLNTTDFNPLSDWNPPLVCLPEKLVEAIKLNNTDSAVIYRWEIPSDEQFSGNLSDETIAKNVRITESYEKACGTPTNSLLPYKSIGDKTISDAVEAVLGTYLQECGVAGALEILMWLDILPRPLGSFSQLFATPLASVLYEQAPVMNILSEIFYPDLEERLGYQFKNKGLLLEAITHPSYTINRATDCYQRLEFLGDAVLDFLITSYIYEYCKNLTPGEVTDIRASLVNNITFASLSVRYEFHKYLLKLSSRLNKAIEEFVTYQANKNYVIDDNMFVLLEESDCLIAEAVQVPKALGDVFESLAGAIFLDSGYSLETVWAIYYRLMKREIDTFTKTVPKNPVRLLYEICEDYPIFEISHKDETVSVSCTAWYDNNEIKTYGIGTNKKEAKRSAAKLAIKKISELKK